MDLPTENESVFKVICTLSINLIMNKHEILILLKLGNKRFFAVENYFLTVNPLVVGLND